MKYQRGIFYVLETRDMLKAVSKAIPGPRCEVVGNGATYHFTFIRLQLSQAPLRLPTFGIGSYTLRLSWLE